MRQEGLDLHRFRLIVSLPRNEAPFATAAQAAGADAVKVHLNCHHPASGTLFGSWQEEKGRIEAVRSAISIPVGLMPGHGVIASKEELQAAASAGLSFLDLYLRDAPAYIYDTPLARWLAVGPEEAAEGFKQIEMFPGDACEASFTDRSRYGTPLDQDDLRVLATLAQRCPRPVLLPTQKAVRPEQVAELQAVGVKGLMIGAVVTGHDPDTLFEATRAFAQRVHAPG